MMNGYFPPSAMMFSAIGDDLTGSESEHLSISRGLLRRLMQAALQEAAFDPEKYLSLNPDLREAWKNGQIADLRQHWVEAGYFEGRKAGHPHVDEEWYLNKYPDVRQAIEAGHVRNATEHFVNSGELELRVPNEALEVDIQRWHRAMLAQIAPIPV